MAQLLSSIIGSVKRTHAPSSRQPAIRRQITPPRRPEYIVGHQALPPAPVAQREALKCTACASVQLTEDGEGVVCMRCGEVLGTVISMREEWRSFADDKEAGVDKARGEAGSVLGTSAVDKHTRATLAKVWAKDAEEKARRAALAAPRASDRDAAALAAPRASDRDAETGKQRVPGMDERRVGGTAFDPKRLTNYQKALRRLADADRALSGNNSIFNDAAAELERLVEAQRAHEAVCCKKRCKHKNYTRKVECVAGAALQRACVRAGVNRDWKDIASLAPLMSYTVDISKKPGELWKASMAFDDIFALQLSGCWPCAAAIAQPAAAAAAAAAGPSSDTPLPPPPPPIAVKAREPLETETRRLCVQLHQPMAVQARSWELLQAWRRESVLLFEPNTAKVACAIYLASAEGCRVGVSTAHLADACLIGEETVLRVLGAVPKPC